MPRRGQEVTVDTTGNKAETPKTPVDVSMGLMGNRPKYIADKSRITGDAAYSLRYSGEHLS